jgi:AraC-like DNA-binding protein
MLQVMRIVPFNIPKPEKEFSRFQVDDMPAFYNKLHQHQEAQLSIILRGTGNLIAADYLGRFQAGDIYLLGSNIPHVFLSDKDEAENSMPENALMKTLFFDFKALESSFRVKELEEIIHLSKQMRGVYKIRFSEEFPFENILEELANSSGIGKLSTSFKILQGIYEQSEMLKLHQNYFPEDFSERDGKRMEQVLNFTLTNSNRSLSLDEVASVANLGKEAFCRFFKERTRKTYTQFLNEIRVSRACHHLRHSDLPVAHVAFLVGFSNLSYFNRTFKKVNGLAPLHYRNQFINRI